MNEVMKNSLCVCLSVSELIDDVQAYVSKLFCELLRLRVSSCLCWLFIDEWRYISFRLSSPGQWKSCSLSPLCHGAHSNRVLITLLALPAICCLYNIVRHLFHLSHPESESFPPQYNLCFCDLNIIL